ncbi:NACHT domain-containing protein [Microbacterium sp. SLBN-111]|uniref:NACHT domain-containing protein n=1 Tax=Microbacterium sp. SLBN-111 TaxID=3377733 RepID=UPI003C734782
MDRAEAVASGPALIHFAVHYAESADFPLEELFFQVPEVADLFASTDISPHTAEAWSRDPFTLLKRFRDELERAERESPSNSNPSKYRRLSSRETAIIVARFLTYEAPTAAADAKSRDRLAARQQQMMELPDRETPGIRRFGLGRPRAGKGEFWRDFEAELRAYILETQRAARAAALTALPEATKRILGYGERYADDLGRRLVGDLPGGLDPRDLYIERECETELVELMRGAPHRLVALSGEAGTGKSSILWSLRRKLADAGLTPLLISATWMTPGGADRLLEVEDVVQHALQIRAANMTPVVLLDTADLLLHTEGLIYRTTDLLQQLSGLRIRAILTVRPREREQLRGVFERKLGDYTAPELDNAVRVLMRRYFPKLSVEVGRDLVRRVETRGLPMTAVLRSPIQLRMLFNTSGGRFPGVDYDVTALYERYWATRIVRDDRGERVPIAQDLSPTAGRLGILMVADATPVVRDRRVSVMLDAVSYPSPLRDGAAGMDDLARRGVLRRGEETWEFAHQTLFEFIAARALVTRNADAAASMLLAHVLAHPYDLFTAAVLEQVVILLAREEATRPAARAITGTLIGQPHASLRPIGVIGWLHVPGMDIPDARSIDQETARRLLAHLPQVQAIDTDQALAVLGAVWRDHRDVAHRQLVACLAILVQRWPERIGEFVVAEQIIPTLLATQRDSYRQSISLVQLAVGVATSHPAAARDLMLHLLQELPEVTGFLRTMAGIAGRWTELEGGEEYAASVVRAAAAAVRRFPSRRRDLGVAAGGVVHALRHRRFAARPPAARVADWESFAADVFSRIGSTAPTIADAADLNAVARHLISADVSERDHVVRILDGLFALEPVDGPFQMVGSFLVAIVAEDGIARAHLVDLLHGVLAHGLPATAKTGRTPAQRWAITARAALLDPDTPEAFVAQVATGLLIGAPDLWREPAYLLAAVFPAAIGGDLRARALLADVAGRPGALHPPSALDPSVVSDFLQARADLRPPFRRRRRVGGRRRGGSPPDGHHRERRCVRAWGVRDPAPPCRYRSAARGDAARPRQRSERRLRGLEEAAGQGPAHADGEADRRRDRPRARSGCPGIPHRNAPRRGAGGSLAGRDGPVAHPPEGARRAAGREWIVALRLAPADGGCRLRFLPRDLRRRGDAGGVGPPVGPRPAPRAPRNRAGRVGSIPSGRGLPPQPAEPVSGSSGRRNRRVRRRRNLGGRESQCHAVQERRQSPSQRRGAAPAGRRGLHRAPPPRGQRLPPLPGEVRRAHRRHVGQSVAGRTAPGGRGLRCRPLRPRRRVSSG